MGRSDSRMGGHLSGYLDGALLGLLQAPKSWHVWDHKSSEKEKVAKLSTLKSTLAIRRLIAKELAENDLGFSTSMQQALNSRTSPQLWRVERDAEAEALMDHWQREQVELKRKNERSGYAAIWARWLEHISRLSLIAALARDQINPMINIDDLRWARAVVDHCIETAIGSAKDFISDGDYEKISKKVQIIVREAGAAGISERDLNRKARSVDPKLRNIIISDLLNQGFITRFDVGAGRQGGRPSVIFKSET